MASIRGALGYSSSILEAFGYSSSILEALGYSSSILEGLGYSASILEGVVLKSPGLATALGYLSSSRTGDLGVSSLYTRLGLCFIWVWTITRMVLQYCFIWANSFLISFLRRSSTYLVQDLVKAFFLD